MKIIVWLGRYVYTLKYLTKQQCLYQLRYRVFGWKKVAQIQFDKPYISQLVCAQRRTNIKIIDITSSTITLLNKKIPVNLEIVNWNPVNTSRLWRYHLHYLDFLQQGDLSDEIKGMLVDQWIARNPQGTETAWEPYTTSLRIGNLVRYFSSLKNVPLHWQNSLFEQTRWLRSNLEYHILANHFFENLCALFISSAYFFHFDESEVVSTEQERKKTAWEIRDWHRFSTIELLIQLDEQFLPDGGHYERSPQYHSLLIQNCIEIFALLNKNSFLNCAELYDSLQKIIPNGLRLLSAICDFEYRIPLLNDSSHDMTPKLDELMHEAQVLHVAPVVVSESARLLRFPDFGIFGLKTTNDLLCIDAGDIGPEYQPGHTHCDLLSYELTLNGSALIVDSGVYEYTEGAMRNYFRSTRAHNTVEIDGAEQSELWGAFRVGRRAELTQKDLVFNGKELIFTGEYVGFYSLSKPAKHRREFKVCIENNRIASLNICDSVGVGAHWQSVSVTSYIHLHPEIEARQDGERIWLIKRKKIIAVLSHSCDSKIRLDKSWYSPEFGILYSNTCIALSTSNTKISYRIDALVEVRRC